MEVRILCSSTSRDFESKYARLAAPAGSITNLALSINKNIVLTIVESSTKTISSINSLIISKVILPGDFIEIPSAIVYPAFTACKEPISTDRFIAGYASDSTPIIFTLGFLDFIAIAMPAANPPPPIGI